MNSTVLSFKLLASLVAGLVTNSNVDIKLVETQQPSKSVLSQLQAFEAFFVYPFSDNEEFIIEHGKKGDYFAFFKHLGTPYYYVATCKKNETIKKKIGNKEIVVYHEAGEVAAAACGVLRTIKNKAGNNIRAWYVCDLKVNPSYQGEHLPVTILKKVMLPRFVQCRRGFAICMNPSTGDPKAASIFKKHGPIPGVKTQTLNLYSLSAQKATGCLEKLTNRLIAHGYMQKDMQLGLVSTSGAKDYRIVNKATGDTRAWNLLHIKAIEKNSTDLIPQKEADHMICAVDGTPLDGDFKAILGVPSSTAQILSYGMEDVDFNFLTSDQI